MRKSLINVAASSLTCWSAGTIFLWIGGDRTIWIGFSWIGLILLSVGFLLCLVALTLFILRGILLDRIFKKRGIDLRIIDFFRRSENERVRSYQHDICLQGSLLLTIPILILLALLSHAILQNSLLAPITNLMALQDQKYLGVYLGVTICLEFPLAILIYALASKDVTDYALNKDEGEEALER